MSAIVPHLRPVLDTGGIRASLPVSGSDWQTLAGLANFCNGHGGMLIPWTAIGYSVAASGTATFHFYVAPKSRAVERIWCINLRSATPGTTASVTCGSASTVTVRPDMTIDRRRGPFIVREHLSSKTSTAGDVAVSVAATGGTVVVESIAMYEQTRKVLALDTTDYGVDITTLAVKKPILDLPNKSAAGVADAYKNLDARRAGFFHWSTDESAPINITGGSFTSLFPLSVQALAAVGTAGTTSSTVTVAARARVNSGTGQVRFASSRASANVTLSVTSTTFAWVTGSLTIESEDLTSADGRRSSAWEEIAVTANNNTATTLSISAISIVRTGTPV